MLQSSFVPVLFILILPCSCHGFCILSDLTRYPCLAWHPGADLLPRFVEQLSPSSVSDITVLRCRAVPSFPSFHFSHTVLKACPLVLQEEEEDEFGGHYTQVLWRATTYVGCATASAPCGHISVCRFVFLMPYVFYRLLSLARLSCSLLSCSPHFSMHEACK